MKKIVTTILATLCVGITASVIATDSVTANADYLVYEMDSLGHPPASVLALEEAKIKNMNDWDYCRVDDEYDGWYFSGDGRAEKNPEIRFIVDGVQTVTKPYTLVPMSVGSFSFEYAIVNDSIEKVEDISTARYIVQILASDGSYPIISVDIEEDGYWHEIEINGNTAIKGMGINDIYTYSSYQQKFCGFLFKMGDLDGELLIRNITVYDLYGNEILPKEESGEEETSSEILSSESENEGGSLETSSPSQTSTTSSASVATAGGCGSFGVGAMTLGTLTAAGVVLGIRKKRK